MSLYSKLLKYIKTDYILIVFFFAYTIIGIFLGDGKQPLIDTLTCVVIISMYVYAQSYLSKRNTLSKNLQILWFINLFYFTVRTFFSDSVGISITTTMRLIMAYLFFTLFYEYSSSNSIKIFLQGIVMLSIVAIVSAGGFILFPNFSFLLPLMNLLFANYGHNYLANLLLVAYPISLFYLLDIPYKEQKREFILASLYFTLIFLAFIFSFSRGIFFLCGLYTLFQLGIYRSRISKEKVMFLSTIVVITLGSFILFSFLTSQHTRKLTPTNNWIFRQMDKPLLSEEGRLKYWKQAIEGFKHRPFFGSGPGTFYLISKRYQEGSMEYSWFAHNFILQILAENGMFGLLFQVILIGYTILISINKNILYKKQLVSIVVLLLANSLFDFNLDFIVIWLLFWSLLGFIAKPI